MRKHYLDNIRWVTVVIVLLYHVLYMYNAEGILGGVGKITNLSVQHYDALMYLVYPWIMPVLYIVAGISSRIVLDKHTNKEFIKSRTRKLLVPSTIGVFVFHFIQGYVSMSFGNAFEELSKAGVPGPVIFIIMVASESGVLWFCHLLWIYSLILVLIRKIEKGRLLKLDAKTPLWMVLLLFFPLWGAAQILNAPMISVYRFGYYLAFFLAGYYVFSNDQVIEKLKKYAVWFIAAGSALCVGLAVIFFWIAKGANYAEMPVNTGALYVACSYFGSLAMIAGFARFGDISNRFTEWMSKRSFGLYVFHYLGISSMALIFAKSGLLPALLCYIISLIAGFAFGYGLYEIISRIPFYRWAVLGIKKEKKHVQRQSDTSEKD